MVLHRAEEHNDAHRRGAGATPEQTAYSQGTRGAIRAPDPRELTMADKSPKKSTSKTAASKSLKEKRADKKTKAANKPNG
jgi:hypothetical protein